MSIQKIPRSPDIPIYAKLDENNVVINIIVAKPEYIASLPDAEYYVLATSSDLSKPRADIGTTYNKDSDLFLHPQPYPSWKLNASYQWVPPVDFPETNGSYEWDEPTQTWKPI